MAVQYIFYFPGGNIFAATNNDVLLAVGNNDGTLWRDMTYITGSKVTLIIDRRASLLLFAIAKH